MQIWQKLHQHSNTINLTTSLNSLLHGVVRTFREQQIEGTTMNAIPSPPNNICTFSTDINLAYMDHFCPS